MSDTELTPTGLANELALWRQQSRKWERQAKNWRAKALLAQAKLIQAQPDGHTGTGNEPKTYGQEYVSKLRAEAASYRMKAKQLRHAATVVTATTPIDDSARHAAG